MEAPVKTRIAPTEIAPETFLIHDHQGEGTEDGPDPGSAPVHEVVDREPGPEHVVGVDVGTLLVIGRPATQHDGQPPLPDPVRQRVVIVQRQE